MVQTCKYITGVLTKIFCVICDLNYNFQTYTIIYTKIYWIYPIYEIIYTARASIQQHGTANVSSGRDIFCLKNSLRWRHNERDSVWNHQPHDCLLNGLFRHRSKKTSKLRVTGLCVGNSPGPVNSPHKGPVTRKMFPFDDVIMFDTVTFVTILR